MDIKKVIKKQGWTLERVAAEMKKPNGEKGLPQSSLSQLIINGNPSYLKLQEIANIIGVSVSELVADDGDNCQHIVCPKCGEVIPIETTVKETT